MIAFDFLLGPSHEIVLCGSQDSESTLKMVSAIHNTFIPNKVLLFKDPEVDSAGISSIAPFTKAMKNIDRNATTAYVCQNFACKVPTTSIVEMLKSLDNSSN